MKTILGLLIVFLSLASVKPAHAQEFNPEFEADLAAEVTESSVVVSREDVKQFQIKIFPHFGKYPTPQNRERSAASVKIVAGSQCAAYEAQQDSRLEWSKAGNALRTAREFEITPKEIQATSRQVIYYQCEAPFKVMRPGLESYTYSGDFVAYTEKNHVILVNLVEPEVYLKGVLPAEIGNAWPDEVMKAQAVAARTYAWWTVLNNRGKNDKYDMDDTIQYQAYQGHRNATDRTNAAVDQTKNKVLKYNGRLIKSYFSADSGGYTASAKDAFGSELHYCEAKRETYDLAGYDSTWKKTITLFELTATLIEEKEIPAASVIKKLVIRPDDRTESGRVKMVTAVLTDGKTYPFPLSILRKLTTLKSTLFNIRLSGDEVLLEGKGFGHGVGMAQIGALQYFKQLHWTYDRILKFYYSGTTLEDER